jgi:sugar O-acyltransferase (sialic acid O-acetyltransferase NeuD family)
MYLYGASGHAKVIIDILNAQNVKIDGLFDDNPNCIALKGVPFLGTYSNFEMVVNSLIISIGNNNIRRRIVEALPGKEFATAVHPSSIISDDVSIGKGTVVMHSAIVQSSTCIGCHCIINTAATVDHDCKIEDYVHISPNSTLCGNVNIGEGSQVGAGAVVLPGVKIGKWAIVGAGAVVVKDVPDNAVVVGNPAIILKNI